MGYHQGDTRCDGKRFWQYRRVKDGSLRESWITEAAYQKAIDGAKRYAATHRKESSNRSKAYALANPEKVRSRAKAYRLKNKAILALKKQQWAKDNRDKKLASQRKYRERNRQALAESAALYRHLNRDQCNLRTKRWRIRHPAKSQSYVAGRRARLRRQTTANANKKLIEMLYVLSNRITQCLGIAFHVDHIRPLSKGGLHHQCNLRVIPATDNLRKAAKLIDDGEIVGPEPLKQLRLRS